MTEPTLTRVLHDLADAPVPDGLADRALRGARARHRRRTASTIIGALAAVGALATPFALRPDGTDRGGAPAVPGAAVAPPAVAMSDVGTCRFLPDQQPVRIKRVEPADWPEFVRIAVGKLPARTDYVMQSGYGVCVPDPVPDPAAGNQRPVTASAYAVINLGEGRQRGHLTVNLQTPTGSGGSATCQELRDQPATRPVEAGTQPPTVLFCEDGTATAPMVYGLRIADSITVGARYADRRTVYVESHPAAPGGTPEISADDLRRVVTDQTLVALLPVG